MCLLCNKVLKPSKLQDHLRRCHPDKTENDLKYFQTLKDKFQKRPTLDRMFASTSQRNDDAKSGKPHTIGEKLILPAVEEVLKTVLHKPASDIIKIIPLSNNTVERRIDEMSSDIESFLCNYLQSTHFSIQLDESTFPDNAALLLAYVRFIMNQEIYEELLFARTLITDTKGESIFHVLKDYFIEKAIPSSNIISVATDGAPAMGGRYPGFISYLKQNVSGVLAIHCVIHRQHLVAKNLSVRLHESLHLVIDAVNRIRSNALNTRLFAQLCEENDEHFHQLLLHTEVRWLSKGLCLTRFFALFETILEFLDTKDFESRFEDILTMVIPPWIINPYGDIEETNVIIQEELTELSTNEEPMVQFKNGYQQFWLQNNIPVTYPVLWNIARKFLISFSSSYLVERGFSAVTNLLTKKRNRLDIISRGDLRLTLTKLTPNVDNLLLKHQANWPYEFCEFYRMIQFYQSNIVVLLSNYVAWMRNLTVDSVVHRFQSFGLKSCCTQTNYLNISSGRSVCMTGTVEGLFEAIVIVLKIVEAKDEEDKSKFDVVEVSSIVVVAAELVSTEVDDDVGNVYTLDSGVEKIVAEEDEEVEVKSVVTTVVSSCISFVV
ncbi:unnamed protein product [Acanthoscelides obtectus]|uniref:HAT C-terminal dimerisation domain-containing protein n=1 Tax=Acanthoscelides obtectus TaxID=200917 RepID=A0A9P0P8K8_ACAOB|nr:unnamed protein product [Acanthoscelides obtectus]CAK1639571.1 Protein ZBED8 [Acanthoscelides obtectus]